MKTITVPVSEVRIGDVIKGQEVTLAVEVNGTMIFHHRFGAYTALGLKEPGCPGRVAVTMVERADVHGLDPHPWPALQPESEFLT